MIGSAPSPLARTAAVVATASFLALAGCGGAAGGEAAKTPEPQERHDVQGPEPTTIEQAEKEIAHAKADLAASAAQASVSPPGPATSAGASADSAPQPSQSEPAPSPQATPASPSRRPPAQEAPKASLTFEDRCASPCRAIASMRRAVTALCRMTSDSDTRCVDAKRTLTDSEQRVTACSC